MPKALCLVGTVVAVLLLLVFGLDLAIKFPFHRVSLTMDIGIAGVFRDPGLLSWTTLREQK